MNTLMRASPPTARDSLFRQMNLPQQILKTLVTAQAIKRRVNFY